MNACMHDVCLFTRLKVLCLYICTWESMLIYANVCMYTCEYILSYVFVYI